MSIHLIGKSSHRSFTSDAIYLLLERLLQTAVDSFTDRIVSRVTKTSCSFRYVPTKEKEFAYITGFSSNVYKSISAAEARISTTSTPRSYISAMLLALKSLLFFCLDIFEP